MRREKNIKQSLKRTFMVNFVAGVGWIAGATVGFSIFAYLLTLVLRGLQVTPFLGEWLADLIVTTQNSLGSKIILQQ